MFTHHMWHACIIVNMYIHLEVFWWCPCCKAGRFEGFLDGPVAGKSVEVWIEGLESSAVHAVDGCRCWRKIRPGRLTWNIHLWKRKIIFQTTIFRFYVNLPGCMFEAMKLDPFYSHMVRLMNLKERWWELLIFRGMIPGTWHFPVDPKHVVKFQLPHLDVLHVAFHGDSNGGVGIRQCAADGENLGGKIISASWWIKGPWIDIVEL